MEASEIVSVLELHRKWLNHEKGGVRANFSGKDLRGADLRWTDLRWANFQGADLRNADLRETNLRETNLRETNLEGAKLPDFQLPAGELIGYKKVSGGVILTLKISKERTASLVGNKCRCRSVKVLSANTEGTEFRSMHDPNFIYRVGETVVVENWSDDIRIECAPGVHFFRTFQEAADYRY